MGHFKELEVYKLSFELAMDIFKISKTFPKEERYSLTDQIRRASRSVVACLAEAYRKRQYKAHFIAKVSDADMENSETQSWLDFALACNYILQENYGKFTSKSESVGRLLNDMIQNPEKYQ